jgi:hypothetical protein
MRVLKRLTTLSSVALAGVLYISVAGNAVAAPGQVQTLQMEPSLPHNLIVSADYQYQGKHYKYKDSGKYYNYRSQQNGKWRYH